MCVRGRERGREGREGDEEEGGKRHRQTRKKETEIQTRRETE